MGRDLLLLIMMNIITKMTAMESIQLKYVITLRIKSTKPAAAPTAIGMMSVSLSLSTM
jgi:hypothetical protein